MKFIKRYGYTLITEDGKYSIDKDFLNETYYIRNEEHKKLIDGFCRKTFKRQKDAKAFVENMYKKALDDSYRWL